jgi:hypothetical protein
MPKYEFLLAANDEADLASGHKRKKQGDIIAVRPHPWKWGSKEVDNYLIVIAESSIDLETLKTKIQDRSQAGDKCRCRISLADVKTKMASLDIKKVEDRELIYQPFKTKESIIENKQVDAKKVDTTCTESKENEEFSFDMDANSLIYDKDVATKVRPSEISEPEEPVAPPKEESREK